jgi:ABC-type phosphate transport system substrate-binding protein
MFERPRSIRFLIRMCLYIAAVAVLFFMRGRFDMRAVTKPIRDQATPDSTLVIAGSEVAPKLIDYIVSRYRRDYPTLRIDLRGGGTTAALQELVNRRADAVFLGRPPTSQEQRIFVTSTEDTAAWFPVALGEIFVIAGLAPAESVSISELRALATGAPIATAKTLYVADPNSGLWDAFLTKLHVAPGTGNAPHGIVFLLDDRAVAEAVRADTKALGLVSAFVIAAKELPADVRVLAVRDAGGSAAVHPEDATTASGEYPLWTYLYLCCLHPGDMQGSKFVTHVTSARGQRQIEWTDYLPAQLVPREVYIDRRPIGA